MNCYKLKDLWKKDEEMSFKGWNFAYLNDRWEDEELPWSYENILRKYLNQEYTLLDMGTGGGEFLLSLKHPYYKTSVTEMWAPNVEECKKKLSPLGIDVQQVYDDKELPFEDNYFDMIINRHESYDANEVKRILKPNGIFITQQVGCKNNESLSKKIIKDFEPKFKDNDLKNRLKELKKNNFEIIFKEEYFPYLHFFDVGAIVYFAKIIEWEFPDFTVDSCFNELCDLQKELNQKSYIESLEHRFIILCKNIK